VTRIRSAATEYWFEVLIAVMAVSGMLELVVGRDSPGAPATSLLVLSTCGVRQVVDVARGGEGRLKIGASACSRHRARD